MKIEDFKNKFARDNGFADWVSIWRYFSSYEKFTEIENKMVAEFPVYKRDLEIKSNLKKREIIDKNKLFKKEGSHYKHFQYGMMTLEQAYELEVNKIAPKRN